MPSRRAQWRRVADQLKPKIPKFAALMDQAEPDVLAYMNFPTQHAPSCTPPIPRTADRRDQMAHRGRRHLMADQIVITEKSSQAKDVRAAVGSRYGDILPAEGHLFDLLEPEDVVPEWKRWSPILLRPEGLYGTRPAEGGNKAAKLKAIREALRTAKRVWLATDCDREGQLIGQEILEHYKYRGQVMRVLFTAQDSQTIRDAFGRAKPNSEYARPLRRRRRAPAGRPDLQSVAHPHRDRHPGTGRAGSDRRWSREDADLGHRVQARAGNPELRAHRLF
jgi:hypothetical protein